jgi:hypothetical protein
MAAISKICSFSTLDKTARRLIAFHRPIKIDLMAKFGLEVANKSFKNMAADPFRLSRLEL